MLFETTPSILIFLLLYETTLPLPVQRGIFPHPPIPSPKLAGGESILQSLAPLGAG
jgi:hypothetical protein